MGCTASKLDNEDTVRRCKERRRLMKEAVYARHHLAAAHLDYLRALRLTGSALSEFAAREPLSVCDQTPAVLLRDPSSVSYRSAAAAAPLSPSTPPPPPPQRQKFSPSPSPTVQRQKSSKLPHILSQSSLSSTPRQQPAGKYNYPFNFPENSTYASTPSQASSVWNWDNLENFYPPSPPGSDFFRRPKDDDHHSDHQSEHHSERHSNHNHLHLDDDFDDKGTEREEVHCSEWGDGNYSDTSSDTKSDDGDGDRDLRSEIGSRSNFGSSVHNEPTAKSNYPPAGISEKSDEAASSVSWNASKDEISDMKIVVRHRDLAEIVEAIKEYFDKAAASGESVSELLETSRAQLDQSFRKLKKTVYHSSSVLSTLSSTWTSKPPLAIKYRLEAGSLDEPGGSKSHCSTLERLLAWEKKLYEEVKAREGVKIEHEKKLASLQNQEYRGEEVAKLDKTKESIKRLQSLIMVTSQAVSTTSSAIIKLRDSELSLQLVDLCHGVWCSTKFCQWQTRNHGAKADYTICFNPYGTTIGAGAHYSELSN